MRRGAGDAGLLVVGGATKNGEFSDRAYVLDTKSYEWTELDAPNGPTARGSACCAALDASRVVFFGGAGRHGLGLSARRPQGDGRPGS